MASTAAGRHFAVPFGLVVLPLATASFAEVPAGFDPGPSLELREHLEHLDVTAREPMLASDLEGVLFVSGYPSRVTGRDWTVPPLLWRSDDGGKRWASVEVGEPAHGAQGNSDVDLAAAADGTLYFAAMGFNRETREGTHVTLGSSTDGGENWRWHMLSRTTLSDRPWIAAGDEGSAFAIWNDGAGVLFTRSPDRGATWTAPERIADSGGSSHLAVGPGELLAVRVSPASASGNRFDAAADFILVSEDQGSTWARRDPPARLRWDPNPDDPEGIPRWVSPLAFTPDGHLHHIWSEGDAVHYAASSDLGNTWTRSKLADADGTAFFPFLTADAEGRLAATWFVNRDSKLTVQLALLTPGEGATKPSVSLAEPFTPDSWEERLDTRRASPAGEYAAAAFLKNGDIGVVTPVQDLHNARGGFSLRRFATKP
ncbi:MAG: sialidase family protein [Pseudomonadota bacterium]